VGGGNYLAPTDADLSSPVAAGNSIVPVSGLLDRLAQTVPVTIVLLDACRTNSFPPGTEVQLPGAAAPVAVDPVGLEALRGPTPLARPDAPPNGMGVVIGFAASPGQAALDGEPGGNSPYAAALLKHFGAGGYSFGDLMTLVTQEVYLKTRAQQLPWTNSSLTRILTFGRTPEAGDADQQAISAGRRALLLSIAGEPEETRRYIETVAAQDGVPLDQLYGMLKVLGVDTRSDATLQQKLEKGAEELKRFMSSAPGAAKSDPELLRLAELATRAQDEGAMALALQYREAASSRADALRAAVDANEAAVKSDRLQIGATYAEHAQAAALNFDYATAAQKFAEAFAQVERWDVERARSYKWSEADSLNNLGRFKGDNDPYRDAIAAYRQALALTARDERPYDWAALNNNMGMVYEQLGERSIGIAELEQAVVTFNAVLEVETREADPYNWAMTQTNLGGALIKIGERTHDVDKLRAGIAAFHLALEVRTFETDPYGWAMTQYNMGTALTILGTRTSQAAPLAEGIAALQAATTGFDRARWPWEWATVQYVLAVNLLSRAAGESGDAAIADAELAIAALDASLEERTRERWPLDWAFSNAILGSAKYFVASLNGDAGTFVESERHYRLALEEMRPERSAVQWAYVMAQLGSTEISLGELTGDADKLRDAVAALQAAQTIHTEAAMPHEWAYDQDVLGWGYRALATVTRDPAAARTARAALLASQDRYRALGDAKQDYFDYRIGQVDALLAELAGAAR
jgi:uncharacterized caspase-like protein